MNRNKKLTVCLGSYVYHNTTWKLGCGKVEGTLFKRVNIVSRGESVCVATPSSLPAVVAGKIAGVALACNVLLEKGTTGVRPIL